ncbi:hypothetical protein [Niallia circulans]|uniref:hypothetical protein n=1 Tax=Niallia circulans TaxID=1397 RepID=UPI0013DE7769|nr:hypothetical protein [Niallia circulans]
MEEEEREKGTERGPSFPFGGRRERKGNRERLSVPVWRKKRGKREQRKSLRSRLEEEEREKGTEKGPPFPFGGRRERIGNRERPSVPVWRKKRGKREQRKALCSLLEEEEREKGTEREPPFPFEGRRERKGNRERPSVPVWRKKREEREQRKALWYHLEEEESFTLSHLNKKAYFPQNSW